MNKRDVRFICGVLLISAGCAACGHKPAYSDIDANKSQRSQGQSNENQSGASASAPGEPAPAAPTQPVPPAQAPHFKSPSFLDQATGEIKDLPSYPQAARVRVQIGPVGEANTASFILATSDSMDKIAAFYERIIKTNRWTVIDKRIDPEFSEWNLQKGEEGAKIQVKKDPRTGTMNIMLVRGEKL